VLYFLRRGNAAITCETRLNPNGPGFELVVSEDEEAHTEQFADLRSLLAREHELLQAWRALGWRDVGPPPRRDGWTGPR
jgi:hypothetical protein